MKFKRYKYLPVFFLVSFLISFSTNVAFSANCTACSLGTFSKANTHLNEKVVKADLNELLFEENENENENEIEFDLALSFISFFLDLTNFERKETTGTTEQFLTLKNPTPIYINTCNFRI